MLVKVITTYKDREAGAVVPANVLMDVSPERYEQINNAPGGPYMEAYGEVTVAQEPGQQETAQEPESKRKKREE